MRKFLMAALCAAATAAIVAPPATATTCGSSTPTANSYADDPADSEAGIAPEVTAVNLSLDAACQLTVTYSVINQSAMVSGDFLSWWLDLDNNTATGSQGGFKGADAALGRLPSGYSGLSLWDGTQMKVVKQIPAVGEFGVRVDLNDLPVTNGVPLVEQGGASWHSDSTGNSYYDWAPEPGLPGFSFAFAFSPAAGQPSSPPPANPTPAPTAPAPANPSPAAPARELPVSKAPVSGSSTSSCRVPRLKGLSLSQARTRLHTAHCKTGRVTRRASSSYYVGKVIRSSPSAGTTLASGAKVNLTVGKRKPRTRRGRAAVAGRPGSQRAVMQRLLDAMG